jgi:hypothetical protein
MCGNCDKKKDREWVGDMAAKTAELTGEPQQVYVHTTYQGDIFDFEPLGIRRENVVKITKLIDGRYVAISIAQQ